MRKVSQELNSLKKLERRDIAARWRLTALSERKAYCPQTYLPDCLAWRGASITDGVVTGF